MSEELVLDAVRFGAILGIGLGIVFALVGREIIDAYHEMRKHNDHARQIHCLKKDWK